MAKSPTAKSAEDFLADVQSAEDFLSDNEPYRPKGEFGETPAPQGSLLRRGLTMMIPSREEAPAAIGGTAGGVLAKRLIPGVGLASLFGGASEAYKQIYEQGQERLGLPEIFKEKPPSTASEALKRILVAGGLGGVGEAFGRGVGKLFSPFSKGMTPEIQAAIEAAKSEGIIPPLTARTKSAFPQAMERFAETSPFGTKITLQKEEALKNFESLAKRVGENIAGDRPPEVTASLVNETLKGFEDSFREAKNKLYDAVLPKLVNEKVDLSNTIRVLKDIIKRRSGEFEPAGLGRLRTILSNLEGKEAESGMIDMFGKSIKKKLPSTVTKYSDLRTMRTNLGREIDTAFDDPGARSLKTDLKGLYGAMSNDLDEVIRVKMPEMADAIIKADDLFSEGINTLKSKLFKELNKVSPDNIHKVMIKPRQPALARMGKELLGEDVFDEVKRQWFDDLLQKSTIKKEGEEILSPQKLASNISKMGESIEAVFEGNEKQLNAFKKLEQIADLLSRGKQVTQGSQTAFLIRSVKGLVNLLTAPVIASEAGKKFLSSGFPKAEFAVRRSVQPVVNILGQKVTEKK